MAKQLYDYWFVQFDFPNEEGKPYKSSGGKMVWNEKLKREIPQGWNNGMLIDIANITMGQSPDGSSYNEVGEGMLFCLNEYYSKYTFLVSTEPSFIIFLIMFNPLAGSFNLIPTTL